MDNIMAIQIPNLGTGNGLTGDNELVIRQKYNANFTDQTNAASRLVGKAAGQVMEVGAFGLGLGNTERKSGFNMFIALDAFAGQSTPTYQMIVTLPWVDDTHAAQILVGLDKSNQIGFRTWDNSLGRWSAYQKIYHAGNTQKDSNGFLKTASPVVDLYDEKIDLNYDAKEQGGITFEKLGVGNYLVKGSLGFAQEGWYIETPKDANGNVLVAVVYKQLANNDISIKTYAKKFDDETGDIVPNLTRPRDIPDGRFISLRLHELPKEPPVMPVDEPKPEV